MAESREPLRRRTKVLLVVGVLAALALSAAALLAWRRRVEAMKPRVHEHEGEVVALAFTPRGDELLTVSGAERRRRVITRWFEPSGLRLAATMLERGAVTSIDTAPSGREFAVGNDEGDVWLFTLDEARPLDEPRSGGPWLFGRGDRAESVVRFSPSGQRVAANGPNGSLRVWSLRDRRKLVPVVGHGREPEEYVRRVLGFASEDEIAFVGIGAVEVRSISKQVVTLTLPKASDGWTRDFVSPRTTLWLSWRYDGAGARTFTGTVRRLRDGEAVGPPVTGPESAAVAFSSDDALLAVATPRSVTIQSVATGSVVFTQPLAAEKGADVSAVAFSPVADRVAVAIGTRVFVFPFRR